MIAATNTARAAPVRSEILMASLSHGPATPQSGIPTLVRPPGLEPGSTGYKPITLTFELRARMLLANILERHHNVLPHRHILKQKIACPVPKACFVRKSGKRRILYVWLSKLLRWYIQYFRPIQNLFTNIHVRIYMQPNT